MANRDRIAGYARKRRRLNPQAKLLSNLRGRLNWALHEAHAPKHASIRKLIGCSIPEFVAHIESQFAAGMSWRNYGRGAGKWHIDHKRPCCSFDLNDPEQQRACFHFSNARPLWAEHNLSKARRDREMSVRDCPPTAGVLDWQRQIRTRKPGRFVVGP